MSSPITCLISYAQPQQVDHMYRTPKCLQFRIILLQGTDAEKQQAGLVLLEVLEAARIVAIMLSPIAPALARLVYLQLGFSDADFEALSWKDSQWGGEDLRAASSSQLNACCLHRVKFDLESTTQSCTQ